jgi:hypothetical protein
MMNLPDMQHLSSLEDAGGDEYPLFHNARPAAARRGRE